MTALALTFKMAAVDFIDNADLKCLSLLLE